MNGDGDEGDYQELEKKKEGEQWGKKGKMIRGGREEELMETNIPTTINQVFEGLDNPYT